jgi:hypothetical protein
MPQGNMDNAGQSLPNMVCSSVRSKRLSDYTVSWSVSFEVILREQNGARE